MSSSSTLTRTGRGEPSLYLFFNDGTGASRVGETVDAYLEQRLKGDPDLPADPSPAQKGQTASNRLAALSPADRRLASLLAARKAKAELEAKIAANSTALTNNFLRVYVKRAEAEIAAGAPADPDPETVHRVNAALGTKSGA